MESNININMGGGSLEGSIVGGEGNKINNYKFTPQDKQNLAEAAKEIQQLLEQLGKSYPNDTTTDKKAIAAEAMNQIKSNPDLKARIFSALKTGSVSALEQSLSHPAASFFITAFEDWQKTKGG